MFKMWGKIINNNKIINQITVSNDNPDTRTHKVFNSLDEICQELNLSRPIWLNKNVNDFKKFSKVRFNQDNFIDIIEFDYLEIQILEED